MRRIGLMFNVDRPCVMYNNYNCISLSSLFEFEFDVVATLFMSCYTRCKIYKFEDRELRSTLNFVIR